MKFACNKNKKLKAKRGVGFVIAGSPLSRAHWGGDYKTSHSLQCHISKECARGMLKLMT